MSRQFVENNFLKIHQKKGKKNRFSLKKKKRKRKLKKEFFSIRETISPRNRKEDKT